MKSTRWLLVFIMLVLAGLPSLAQRETRSQCIRRLDQEVLVETDEEIEAWLDRIVEECPPPPAPDEPEPEEADEQEDTDSAEADEEEADEEEDSEQPDPSTLVACYPGNSAYVNGSINVRGGPGTDFDIVDVVRNATVSVIGSGRGATFCWLQIGEDRWIAWLNQVLGSKPVVTSPPAQEASAPAAAQDDPPPQQSQQQFGSDNYFFERRGSARSSVFPMARGKWHWRIRTTGDVVGLITQQGEGNCFTIRGVNTGRAYFAETQGAGAFEVRYDCMSSLKSACREMPNGKSGWIG